MKTYAQIQLLPLTTKYILGIVVRNHRKARTVHFISTTKFEFMAANTVFCITKYRKGGLIGFFFCSIHNHLFFVIT